MMDGGDVNADDVLRVPAREIPVPAFLSPQARAALIAGARRPTPPPSPALDDTAGWERSAAESDAFMASLKLGAAADLLVESEAITLGNVPSYGIRLRKPVAESAGNILF